MSNIVVPMRDITGGQLMIPTFTAVQQKQIAYQPIWHASELEDDAKEKVLEKYRDINVDFGDWYDYVEESFKEDMKSIGFIVTHVYFLPCFSSQGDGACFEGDLMNTKLFITKLFKPDKTTALAMELGAIGANLLPKALELQLAYRDELVRWFAEALNVGTRHTGHYYHSNCMTVDVSIDMEAFEGPDPDNAHDEMYRLVEGTQEKIEEAITDFLREQADDLYKRLGKEYDYLTTEEAICEALDANEHLFYADGTEE